jgi:uncharacterized protein with PQ loop repeat
MSFLLRQIKNFFTNRIGLALVFVNLFLALWGIFEKGGNYSHYHYYYEPIPIKILTWINLPIIIVAESISRTLFPLPASPWSFVRISNFDMSLIVIFSIFQWLFFGYLCNLIFPKKLK